MTADQPFTFSENELRPFLSVFLDDCRVYFRDFWAVFGTLFLVSFLGAIIALPLHFLYGPEISTLACASVLILSFGSRQVRNRLFKFVGGVHIGQKVPTLTPQHERFIPLASSKRVGEGAACFDSDGKLRPDEWTKSFVVMLSYQESVSRQFIVRVLSKSDLIETTHWRKSPSQRKPRHAEKHCLEKDIEMLMLACEASSEPLFTYTMPNERACNVYFVAKEMHEVRERAYKTQFELCSQWHRGAGKNRRPGPPTSNEIVVSARQAVEVMLERMGAAQVASASLLFFRPQETSIVWHDLVCVSATDWWHSNVSKKKAGKSGASEKINMAMQLRAFRRALSQLSID